jgi:hypothetical protein
MFMEGWMSIIVDVNLGHCNQHAIYRKRKEVLAGRFVTKSGSFIKRIFGTT